MLALARAVTKTPKHHHITPVLKKLHWHKIPERIEYKVISFTYNTLPSCQPSYLRQLFTIQIPRSTRSSSTLTLPRPSSCHLVRGHPFMTSTKISRFRPPSPCPHPST